MGATKIALIVKDQSITKEISVASDLALHQAFLRRTLAFDLVGSATFETMQKWNNRLFELYSQQPAPGFHKVSQPQLLRADRRSFLRMAELFTGSLKVSSTARPLDALFEQLHTDVSVTYFMLPMASSSSSSGDKHADSQAKQSDKKKRPIEKTETKPQPPYGSNNKYKKGKGKGQSKASKDPIPLAQQDTSGQIHLLFVEPGQVRQR